MHVYTQLDVICLYWDIHSKVLLYVIGRKQPSWRRRISEILMVSLLGCSKPSYTKQGHTLSVLLLHLVTVDAHGLIQYINYILDSMSSIYHSEEDLEKLLATYAKQNKSSVFLGGTHDPTTASPQCYTTGSSRGLQKCNKTGHDRAVNQANSSGVGLQVNPETISSHPQLRKNPISSQVDQYSAHTPVTRTPKSAWTGDLPLSSSLYPKHCTKHTESHQKSLNSLTRFLAGVNGNSTNTVRSQDARTGADPGERRSSAAGRVRLKPHQRSLSVQSVASTTSSTASSRCIGPGLNQPC